MTFQVSFSSFKGETSGVKLIPSVDEHLHVNIRLTQLSRNNRQHSALKIGVKGTFCARPMLF